MADQKKETSELSDENVMSPEQIWLEVDNRIKNGTKNQLKVARDDTKDGTDIRPHQSEGFRDWKTVRVFISSTFKDFQNEREILVKEVFPDLRAWCRDRKLHLYECDLRWGVRWEDSHQSAKICLDEIDKCMKYNPNPFFIGMISQRVGYVPRIKKKLDSEIKQDEEEQKIQSDNYLKCNPKLGVFNRLRQRVGDVPPQNTKDKAQKKKEKDQKEQDALKEVFSLYGELVEGLSVTEMEIVHGAYSLDNPNALFMIREDNFVDLIQNAIDKCGSETSDRTKQLQNILKDMQPCGDEEKAKKIELRNQITKNPFFKSQNSVRCYSCKVDEPPVIKSMEGTVFDREDENKLKKKLDKYIKLDVDPSFKKEVTEFLKQRIDACYPLCSHREGLASNESTCAKCKSMFQSMSVYNKQKYMHDAFMQWKQETFVGRDDDLKKMDEYIEDSTFRPLLVVGDPGVGKSALMAKVVKNLVTKLQGEPNRLFFHFVGPVSRSTESKLLQQRIVKHLLQLKDSEDSEIKQDDDLHQQVSSALSNTYDKCRIVVIDALNQLNDDDAQNVLRWIPKETKSVKCIISVVRNSSLIAQFSHIDKPPLIIGPLGVNDAKAIAKNYLDPFGKKLDDLQCEILFKKTDCCNPLWLTTACEHLRVFWSFNMLDHEVKKLPEKLSGLLDLVLQRLLEESRDSELFKAALCLIAISRHGLLETELTQILGYQRQCVETLHARGLIKNRTIDHINSPLEAGRWAYISQDLSFFVRPFCDSGEGQLDFHHQSFRDSVKKNYMSTERSERSHHQILARYFYKKNLTSTSIERQIESYPHHAVAIGDYANLERFLSRWSVIETAYKSYPNFCAPLVKGWQQVHKGKNDPTRMRKKLIALADEVDKVDKVVKVDEVTVKKAFEKITMIVHILCHAAEYVAAVKPARRALDLAPDSEKVKAKFLLAEVLANSTRWNAASKYKHVPVMKEACKQQKEALDALVEDDQKTVMRLKGQLNLASYKGFLAAFQFITDCKFFVCDYVRPKEAEKLVREGMDILQEVQDAVKNGNVTDCYSTFELDCLMAKGRLLRGNLKEAVKVWRDVQTQSISLLGRGNNYENVSLLNEAMCNHDEGRNFYDKKKFQDAVPYHLEAYKLYFKYYDQIVDIYGDEHQKCRACRGYMQSYEFRKLIASGHIKYSRNFKSNSRTCCLM